MRGWKCQTQRGERLCWVSCRHRGRRGCKYSWLSCQRAAPLCWLLSLHWSLIHDIHVQWPPSLTSIMREEVPFSPTCLMSVSPGEGRMLIPPTSWALCTPFMIVCTMQNWEPSWTLYISLWYSLVSLQSQSVWCPCFINLPWLYLLTHLRSENCMNAKISWWGEEIGALAAALFKSKLYFPRWRLCEGTLNLSWEGFPLRPPPDNKLGVGCDCRVSTTSHWSLLHWHILYTGKVF